MPALTPELERLLAQTRLELLPEDYYIVRLPADTKAIPGEWYRPATTRFAVFIRAPRGITLVVSRRKWLRMQNLFESYDISQPMRVMTLDLEIPLGTAGYVAALAGPLAAAGISIVPIAGYDRDHIIVQKQDLPRAARVLREFLAGCRR
jgi:hypothetical protein